MGSQFTSKPFPGFENLFSLRDPCSSRYYRADVTLPAELQGLPHPVVRAEWRPVDPPVVTHMTGAPSPSDVVWTSYGTIIILSQRVVDLMQANGFTGWTTYPVSVHTKSGEVVPGYRGLAVTGRCGPIDDSRCRKVLRKYPARTVEQAVGLYFDDASWDGSDLFCASDGTGFVFCTAAVKRALERAKVRNLRLSCVEDIDNYGPLALLRV